MYMKHGEIYNGDVVIGGQIFVDKKRVLLNRYCSVSEQPNAIDFNAWFVSLRSLSTNLCNIPSTGTVQLVTPGDTIILTETTPAEQQVFLVTADQLMLSKNWILKVGPGTKAILVNVVGTTAGFGTNGGVSLRNFEKFRTKTLWNFCDATDIILERVGVVGTILAPWASFENPKGEAYGQIFGVNWNGPLQQHAVFYDYCPTAAQTTGTTGATTTVPQTTGTTGATTTVPQTTGTTGATTTVRQTTGTTGATTVPQTTGTTGYCCCAANNQASNATCCGSCVDFTACYLDNTTPCCICCPGIDGLKDKVEDKMMFPMLKKNMNQYFVLISIAAFLLVIVIILAAVLLYKKYKNVKENENI